MSKLELVIILKHLLEFIEAVDRMSFKKVFVIQRKHLCRSLFLTASFRSATLLKRGSSTGVFLRTLQDFSKHLFYRTPTGDYLTTSGFMSNSYNKYNY